MTMREEANNTGRFPGASPQRWSEIPRPMVASSTECYIWSKNLRKVASVARSHYVVLGTLWSAAARTAGRPDATLPGRPPAGRTRETRPYLLPRDDDRRAVSGSVLELDVAGEQAAAERFGERDVGGVVGAEVVPQLRSTAALAVASA
jgi:hypothetical protein